MEKLKAWGGFIGTIAIIVLIISFFWWLFFSVDAGERAVLITLGKVSSKSYSNGFFWKMPFISNVVKYDIRNQKVEATSIASSKDMQEITTILAINYTLDATKIPDIYQNIGKKDIIEANIITPSIQETVKAVFAKYTAEGLIKNRLEASANIKKDLIAKYEKHGIKLIDVNVINFQFSEIFSKAIESKATAEQEALIEKNNLEKVKYKAQQGIEEAKGLAETVRINAEAEAEKIRINAEAIKKQGGSDYIQLEFIKKWNGELPKVASNGNILNVGDILKGGK